MMYTFAHWVPTPESRAAHLAVQRLLRHVAAGRAPRELNPLFLHGPAGCGKTHLTAALVHEATVLRPDLVVAVTAAGDLDTAFGRDAENDPDEADHARHALRDADLLVLEDLQHLPPRLASHVARLLDQRLVRRRTTVATATCGPARLVQLPGRLTSRLGAGLVVGIEPLAVASRLALLSDKARRRQLDVRPDALAWLADHVGPSGRALEGALGRLEALARLHGRSPGVREVAAAFAAEETATRPSVDRILQRVSGFFQVDADQICSRRRLRNALLPRQVGMYLARQLTTLSLQQIGACFGGRDHSTVLHACRKVETALARDPDLSGAVRRLHADLG